MFDKFSSKSKNNCLVAIKYPYNPPNNKCSLVALNCTPIGHCCLLIAKTKFSHCSW